MPDFAKLLFDQSSEQLCGSMRRQAHVVIVLTGLIISVIGIFSSSDCAAAIASVWHEFKPAFLNFSVRVPGNADNMENFLATVWWTHYKGATYKVAAGIVDLKIDGDQATAADIEQSRKDNFTGHVIVETVRGQGWKGKRWHTLPKTTPQRYGVNALNDQGDMSYHLDVAGPAPMSDINTFLGSLVVLPDPWKDYEVPELNCVVRIPVTSDLVKKISKSYDMMTFDYKGASYAIGAIPTPKSTGITETIVGIRERWTQELDKDGLISGNSDGEGWNGLMWRTPPNVTPKRIGLRAVSEKADLTYMLSVEGPATSEDASTFLRSLRLRQ